MIQKPKGTFDILPEEIPYWQFIEQKARKVSRRFGFREIRTPVFEATELFQRGVGNTTDVVQKEMYTFEDRDGRSLTLRPEGTAGIARAIIENGKCGDAMPLKLFYFINCFRYEKPQAGRSREFWQFGTEMYGAETPEADAEVISLAHSLLKEIGLTEITLHINSIGCPNCRPTYRAALKSYFEANKEPLCDTCKGRLETNPMRILDCKSPICKEIAKNAPKTFEHLCADCSAHMDALCANLNALNIPYEIDPNIVRGLDYYTRTVFEFITPVIGAQSTVCGGGRYDGLVKEIGGPNLSGIGFAMGITRLILALEATGKLPATDYETDLYIASMGKDAAKAALTIAGAVRDADLRCESDLVSRSLKAQMKYADKKGARFTLILGDNELLSGKANLKNMKTSEQTEVDIRNIPALLSLIR
ncbi:MAG: histidine--tRNA ligase [Ruminococcaceae bacterium]|nr:histidine--tRNA ligase [Oscillospiraceae bacterium]